MWWYMVRLDRQAEPVTPATMYRGHTVQTKLNIEPTTVGLTHTHQINRNTVKPINLLPDNGLLVQVHHHCTIIEDWLSFLSLC